ncbi:MAG TPA: ATP-binding cassette domain-containing protein [bacterium]|nr:ATP-binding cassette domain-containing protein [bacterium]
MLLGPSGCGKTTLVRIMAGLERRTSGELSIARTDGGKPLTAMVFQEDSVFPWMTVEENIGYGLHIQGVPEPVVKGVRDFNDGFFKKQAGKRHEVIAALASIPR